MLIFQLTKPPIVEHQILIYVLVARDLHVHLFLPILAVLLPLILTQWILRQERFVKWRWCHYWGERGQDVLLHHRFGIVHLLDFLGYVFYQLSFVLVFVLILLRRDILLKFRLFLRRLRFVRLEQLENGILLCLRFRCLLLLFLDLLVQVVHLLFMLYFFHSLVHDGAGVDFFRRYRGCLIADDRDWFLINFDLYIVGRDTLLLFWCGFWLQFLFDFDVDVRWFDRTGGGSDGARLKLTLFLFFLLVNFLFRFLQIVFEVFQVL